MVLLLVRPLKPCSSRGALPRLQMINKSKHVLLVLWMDETECWLFCCFEPFIFCLFYQNWCMNSWLLTGQCYLMCDGVLIKFLPLYDVNQLYSWRLCWAWFIPGKMVSIALWKWLLAYIIFGCYVVHNASAKYTMMVING